ncbi:molybdopterin-binding protein [Alkaliphilus pronyensis]|uniref:Molybdopterin molybdenumtransferase n=1 Tax=Alkaliphilus pronyensis TaxID=1482732 RepID=A0A6I0FEL5_9FIRM|nr:molybdopterin-binding protein [Alkaliphilus pronyensis]KAB3537696.1 molybdopterin-binding protein [Alkaliphilus pronyensis]
MKAIPTVEAIGKVIAHDLTEIRPGEFKGAAFKKGHVISKKDIEHLLRIGKEHIYVIELKEDELHEDDAAVSIGELICGEGVYFTEPSEGKINIKAEYNGLLKIDRRLLDEVNDLGEVCLATIHGNVNIQKDGLIGGFRVIPLIISKRKLQAINDILSTSNKPMLRVKPFKQLKAAIIVTGGEVYRGLIEDKFGPVVKSKLNKYNCEVIMNTIVPDDIDEIKEAILEAKTMGAEFIVVTGGMSVDPDDKTPGAIKATGAEIIAYGTPVLPGSMLLVSYLDHIPVMGLPGCVMFSHTTAFDILLPRVFAGEAIERRDITGLGYGGQCLKCKECSFPICHFGKV